MVSGKNASIWNSTWIISAQLKAALQPKKFLDQKL